MKSLHRDLCALDFGRLMGVCYRDPKSIGRSFGTSVPPTRARVVEVHDVHDLVVDAARW